MLRCGRVSRGTGKVSRHSGSGVSYSLGAAAAQTVAASAGVRRGAAGQQSESESGGGGTSERAGHERHGGTRPHAWV